MSIRKYNIFAFAVLALSSMLLMTSCSHNEEGQHKKRHHRSLLTPASSGNPYEVMVVADDSLWTGYAGRALKRVLNKPMPMLNQEESTFHVSHIETNRYDRITNIFRNIIIMEVSPYTTRAKFSIERNTFSSPQLIMKIKGPSQQQISSYITENTSKIIQCFAAEEINRYATELEDDHNIVFNKKVKEMFGCELYIPTDINKMKIGDNFIWASNDGLATIQNICIYSYPYATERVFNRGVFIALRDSFMKKNIPGDKPNQWMSTNRDFVEVKDINIQGRYCQEARGLWEMTNVAMGGPFVSHSEIDTVNNRVIVVEGFVYAPSKMKRTMMRRLEAALYTLRVP